MLVLIEASSDVLKNASVPLTTFCLFGFRLEMSDGPGEEINRHFIISAKSQKLTVRTGQPPEAPSNLGVLASTCHSLQIGWDPPIERGVEVKRKNSVSHSLFQLVNHSL